MRSIFRFSFFFFLLVCTFTISVTAQTFLNHTDAVTTVTFSPDGKTLASGSLDRKIILWDVAKNQPDKVLLGHNSYVYSVVYTPDGKSLISGSGDKTIRFWDSKTGKETRKLEGHEASVMVLALSSNGKTLASGDAFGIIKLWDVESGKTLHSLYGERMITSLVFSPDGKFVADARNDLFIRVWDAETGKGLRTFSNGDSFIHTLAISPNGKMLAAASWVFSSLFFASADTIIILDLTGRVETPTNYETSSRCMSLMFSRDNQKLFGAFSDGTISTSNLQDILAKIETSQVGSFFHSMSLSADGKLIAGSGGLSKKPLLLLLDGVSKKSIIDLVAETSRKNSEASSANDSSIKKESSVNIGSGQMAGGGGPAGNKSSGEIDYNKVFRANEVTKKAIITEKIQPEYTEKARLTMTQGVVRITAVLNANGNVTGIRAVSELPFGLTDMAVRAAKRVKFIPANVNERAVSQYITFEYNFRVY